MLKKSCASQHALETMASVIHAQHQNLRALSLQKPTIGRELRSTKSSRRTRRYPSTRLAYVTKQLLFRCSC